VRYLWGSLPTTYNYTGQRLDGSAGLLYYGARYYDPALGRFIQPDTLVPEPGNPQSLNRYAYVLNNPLKYTDPTGHCEENDNYCWSLIEQLQNAYGIYASDNWAVKELEVVIQAVREIALKLGNGNLDLGQAVFRELFNGTRFNRVDAEGVPIAEWVIGPHRAMTGPTGEVFFPNGWDAGGWYDWAVFTVAHELAHVWDIRSYKPGGSLSFNMAVATGARFPPALFFSHCPCPGVHHAKWEDPDEPPYAANNPGEDLAQSFAAWVFDSENLSRGRTTFINQQVGLVVNMFLPPPPPSVPSAPQAVPIPTPSIRGTPIP
jgi:RHS repeat-associated protein